MNDRPEPSSIGLTDILSGRSIAQDQRAQQEAILRHNVFLFGEGPASEEARIGAERVLFGHHGEQVPADLPDAAFSPRPMTSFLDSLSPEQKAAALAYKGPENIGKADFRLDSPLYMQGPSTFTHAGAGEERQRRTRVALEELALIDADELCG